MGNPIFLGITGLAGVFILMAAIWYGATDHNDWYIAPAICGFFAALSILGMMGIGLGRPTTVGWISAVVFEVLGVIFLWVASQREQTRHA